MYALLVSLALLGASPVVHVAIDHAKVPAATGFAVGKTSNGFGIFVTANHVVDCGPTEITETGAKLSYVMARDWENDVALLVFPWTGPTVNLADQLPAIGDSVVFVGATSGQQYGMVTKVGNGDEGLWITPPARNGDSGSPVLDAKRDVVGLVAGGYGANVKTWSGQNTYGPNCRAIRGLLQRAGWICENGVCRQIVPAQQQPIIAGVITQQPTEITIPPPSIPVPSPIQPTQPIEVDYERIKRDGNDNINPIIDLLGQVLNKEDETGPSILEKIQGMGDHVASIGSVVESVGSKLDIVNEGVSDRIEGLGSKLESIGSTVSSLGPNAPIETNQEGRNILGIPITSLAAAGLSALGIGVPTWLLVFLRGARVVRKVRQKRSAGEETRLSASPAPAAIIPTPDQGSAAVAAAPRTHTVTVDTPPPPPVNRIDTQYVQVPVDDHQRASEMAWQQIVRKYPGEESIQMIHRQLTDQYLAGMTK